MSAARLPAKVVATGLIRLAESKGGFGVVVAKGDETAGAIAVILLENGRNPRFLERAFGPDGTYGWRDSTQPADNEQEFRLFLEKRRKIDPDLWILELDVARPERFAAEMKSVC